MLRVYQRPLLGTIVKPKVGLQPGEHSSVAYEAWLGGCDLVKDDENLANQDFNKFKDRFLKTIKAMEKAEKETGEKKAYMVNCTAETEAMKKRINFVQRHGGNYIMLDILTLGWSALQTARNISKLPIHAHRAGHAMLDRPKNKGFGMSMEVIAEFTRMVGADSLHIGTVVGKMEGSKDEVLHIEREMEEQQTKISRTNLGQRWYNMKPVMAVASGGLYPRLVPEIIKMMDKDVIIQMGGGIHGNRLGTRDGAVAARQAIDASIKGISLMEYSKTHQELRDTLRQW